MPPSPGPSHTRPKKISPPSFSALTCRPPAVLAPLVSLSSKDQMREKKKEKGEKGSLRKIPLEKGGTRKQRYSTHP